MSARLSSPEALHDWTNRPRLARRVAPEILFKALEENRRIIRTVFSSRAQWDHHRHVLTHHCANVTCSLEKGWPAGLCLGVEYQNILQLNTRDGT